MGKQSGLGQKLFSGGYDISGDTQQLKGVSGSQGTTDVTGIDKSARERIGAERDGKIEVVTFFNPGLLAEHVALSPLPTADVGVMYCAAGPTLGVPAACMVAKQIGYNPTRGNDGSLTFDAEFDANGFGLEWGNLLTAGLRTDTAATNGSSYDTLASAAFGGQAYLQVTAFVGTDVTVKIQDSADNATFADVSTFAFAQITSTTPQSQRIAVGNTATLRRYLRAATVTTGGVTSVTFAVTIVKNATSGIVF